MHFIADETLKKLFNNASRSRALKLLVYYVFAYCSIGYLIDIGKQVESIL